MPKWPSQIDDARTHIRWVRAHASSLGIDPARIAIAGYSAGGHIAPLSSNALTENYPTASFRRFVGV